MKNLSFFTSVVTCATTIGVVNGAVFPGLIDVNHVLRPYGASPFNTLIEMDTSSAQGKTLYAEVAIHYLHQNEPQEVVLNICDGQSVKDKKITLGGRKQKYVSYSAWETEYVTLSVSPCPTKVSNLDLKTTGNFTVEVGDIQLNNFNLVWEDNFDGTSLDSKKWEYEIVSSILVCSVHSISKHRLNLVSKVSIY